MTQAYAKGSLQLRDLKDDRERKRDRKRLLGILAFESEDYRSKHPERARRYTGQGIESERRRLIEKLPQFIESSSTDDPHLDTDPQEGLSNDAHSP